MSEDKQYGLNIDEQAFSMWITCRFNTNPENSKLMVEYQYFGGQWCPIPTPKEPTP